MKKGNRLIWMLLIILSLGFVFAGEAMAQVERVVFEGYDDPDGAGPQGDWEIYYMDLPNTTPIRLINNGYDDVDPCISPDASYVVYSSKRNGKFGIYMMNITTKVETTVSQTLDTAAQPAFSTRRSIGVSSGWIVFSGIPTSETDWEIYKIQYNQTNGTISLGPLQRVTYDFWNNKAPSHNGAYIVFQSSRVTPNNKDNWEIIRMNMNGTDQTILSSNLANDMDPVIHSSGNMVAFASERDDTNAEIYVMDITGNTVQRVTMDSAVQTSPYFADITTGDTVVFISHHATSKGRIYADTIPIPMTSGAWTLWVNDAGIEYMEMNSPSWAVLNVSDTPTNVRKTFQCIADDSGEYITWNRGSPNDSEDTFQIQISSSCLNEGASWTTVGTTSDTDYFDTTALDLRGCTVAYRVRGWNRAGPSGWGVTADNFVNYTNLWLQKVPLNNSVTAGEQFRVDIMSDTVSYMDTLLICVTYDTNTFSTPSVRLGDATDSPARLGTDLMVTADTEAGRITILVNMRDVNNAVTTTSDTSLVEVYLYATGNDTGTCYPVNLEKCSYTSCGTLCDTPTMGDTAAREICVMSITGTEICIDDGWQAPPAARCLGDVNCDTSVNILDITKLERCLLGLDDDCYCNWANADANKDGKISSADITAIERIILGLPLAPAPAKMTAPGVIAQLRMRGVDTNELKLWGGEIQDFDTLQCDFSFDPAKMRIEKVEAGSLTEGAFILSNIQNEQGRVMVVLNMPGISGVNGSGDLLRITLAKAASAGDISINEIILGSNQAIELPFGLLNPEAIPSRSFLSQNYPNPINPETWIPFSLSNSDRVVVNIYSLSGQLIRTLDLGEKAAGIYEIKDKAAYWDGKDNQGQETASGIYLYQLKAGDFTSTRKMIVLK